MLCCFGGGGGQAPGSTTVGGGVSHPGPAPKLPFSPDVVSEQSAKKTQLSTPSGQAAVPSDISPQVCRVCSTCVKSLALPKAGHPPQVLKGVASLLGLLFLPVTGATPAHARLIDAQNWPSIAEQNYSDK